MSIFNFLSKNKNNNRHSKETKTPPRQLLHLMGLEMIWDAFVGCENEAVQEYQKYLQYTKQLNQKYSNIDFSRVVYQFNSGSSIMPLTAGEVMYFKLLDMAKEDLHISKSEDKENASKLSQEEYQEILGKLKLQENMYCDELKKYLDENIASRIDYVSNELWGVRIKQHSVPLNTLNCVQYHRYLAAQDIDLSDEKYSKWNNVRSAPILERKTTAENPLILISIEYIDVGVLDYLCYGFMSLPTVDTMKLMGYKDEKTGQTVAQKLKDTFGENALTYMKNIVKDMNGAAFRSWMRLGLELE